MPGYVRWWFQDVLGGGVMMCNVIVHARMCQVVLS